MIHMKKVIIFICSFIFSLSLLQDDISAKGLDNLLKINVADFIKRTDLSELGNRIQKGNILDYLRIRQRLYSFTFDELNELKKHIKKNASMKFIANLIDKIAEGKAELYNFKEDFLLNNKPLLEDRPFFPDKERTIKGIVIKSERLYFNNLKLSYKKNELKTIDDSLSINPQIVKKSDRSFKIKKSDPMEKYIDEEYVFQRAYQKWQFRLNPNSLYDISDPRMYLKKYSENMIQPIILGNTLFLRNEYRLFAVDLHSGKQIWSVSPDTSGEEFYETAIHMHHNPYGYEMLLDNGMLYTELAGKLVAYDITGREEPMLKWENDLGEYTLATKPVKSKEILVTGLINARGELWICGFSPQEGVLEWSTYIGLSSFVSPVCNISSVSYERDERVFIGTNHGMLICIRPTDGELVWVRSYEPRKHGVFNWFSDKHFLYKNIEHEGFIEFDSQFLIDDTIGNIAYKPRESDVFYLLNSRSGELVDTIRNDLKKCYILGAVDSDLVILERHNINARKLTIIDYSDGRVIYSRVLKPGRLMGILRKSREELVFKIGKTVYKLSFKKDKIGLNETDCGKEGWLLGYESNLIFLGKNNTIQCLRISEKNHDSNNSYKEGIENSHRQNKKIDSLFHYLQDPNMPIQQVISVIAGNMEEMKDERLREFFLKLEDIYGDEIIEYKDVNLRFDRFLWALGLADIPLKGNPYLPKQKPLKNKFSVKGSFISFLSIEVIKGTEPNFFIMSHNDMVYCIDESGAILWGRKIAFVKRRGGAKDIDVYLYNGVIVINDKINVVAVDSKTGSYIWSVTKKGEYDKNLFVKAENEIKYKLAFLDDNVISIHKNKLSMLDPISGFCIKDVLFDVDNVEKVWAFDGKIFLYARKGDDHDIYVLNKDLETRSRIKLGDKRTNFKYIDLCLFEGKVVIMASPRIYAYDIATEKTELFFDFGDPSEVYLKKSHKNLIVVEPFKRIMGFKPDGNDFVVEWSLDFESRDVESVLDKDFETSFIIEGSNAIILTQKDEKYSLISINTENGVQNWERELSFIDGKFADLYNMHCVDDFIHLIMYTAFKLSTGAEKKSISEKEAWVFNLYPTLLKLNKTTGDVEYANEFPHIVNYGYRRQGVITHTKNYVLLTINENYLSVEKR